MHSCGRCELPRFPRREPCRARSTVRENRSFLPSPWADSDRTGAHFRREPCSGMNAVGDVPDRHVLSHPLQATRIATCAVRLRRAACSRRCGAMRSAMPGQSSRTLNPMAAVDVRGYGTRRGKAPARPVFAEILVDQIIWERFVARWHWRVSRKHDRSTGHDLGGGDVDTFARPVRAHAPEPRTPDASRSGGTPWD